MFLIFKTLLGAVHNCQHFHECTNHTLSETPFPPPQKKCTHQHFLSAKNSHENNKNQAKKLKVYGKNFDFHRPPTPGKCMVCTLVKMLTFMDNPLTRLYFSQLNSI